jgi:hypothetical protein
MNTKKAPSRSEKKVWVQPTSGQRMIKLQKGLFLHYQLKHGEDGQLESLATNSLSCQDVTANDNSWLEYVPDPKEAELTNVAIVNYYHGLLGSLGIVI